jgi:gliding motility-associated-like protein
VYIGDSSGSSIQKWIPGATAGITIAGGNGVGSAANQLNGPIFAFLDSHGDLFISDANNQRVQEWLPGAASGITVAGGNGAGSSANQLTDPVSIAVDAAGNLYVSDATNNRVQKWAPGATFGVTVAGGNGVGSAANQLNGPQGIALDAHGNLFVADDQNYRIQEWLPGASSGITVAGGSFGGGNNQFDTQQGIYVDDSDDVYIADSHALRIMEWKPGATTGIPIIVAHTLTGPTGLYYPMDVVVTTNYIYVSDLGNSRVQRYALHAGLDTNYIPSVAGNYSAVVTNSTGCTGTTDTLSVRPTILPSISILASADTICTGTPVNFTAVATDGGSIPVYQWQLNGNTVGTNSNVYSNNNLSNNDTVTCILTSSYLCATTVSSNKIGITVNSIVTPTVTITTSTTTICAGTPVIFTAVATYGGSAPVYQWKLNGNDVGTNNNTYTSNNLVNGDEVSCILTSSLTCVTSPVAVSDTILMNVITAAAPSVTITAFPNPICAGDTVIFNTTTANPGLSPSYQWQVNGNNTGNTNPVYITNQLTEDDSVSCTITINQTGCYQNDEVISNKIGVTINPIPVITFNPAALTVAKGDSIQINASINDNNATYLWVPTTGLSNTSILDPFVSPIVNTTYKLFAMSNGCTDSNAIVINVYAKIYIPNAFSPNGDVPHDTWVIENLDEYPEADVTVFNRWGQVIFEETDGYRQKWDGTYNGKPLPVGAYYYIIKTTPNAPPIAGCISIIR